MAKTLETRDSIDGSQGELVACDIRVIIEDVLAEHAQQASKNGTVLGNVIDPQVPSLVMLRPQLFRQILNALLAQTLTTYREGKVTVYVEAESLSDGRLNLEVAVIGTASINRHVFGDQAPDRIHEEQGASDLTSHYSRGDGSLQDLANQMGVKIQTIGIQPQGSKAFFRFTTKGEALRSGPRSNLTDKQLLVVSVNDDFQVTIGNQIQLRQMRCVLAEDFRIARRLLEKNSNISMVVIDAQSFSCESIGTFVDDLKQGKSCSEVPVLLVTSSKRFEQVHGASVVTLANGLRQRELYQQTAHLLGETKRSVK